MRVEHLCEQPTSCANCRLQSTTGHQVLFAANGVGKDQNKVADLAVRVSRVIHQAHYALCCHNVLECVLPTAIASHHINPPPLADVASSRSFDHWLAVTSHCLHQPLRSCMVTYTTTIAHHNTQDAIRGWEGIHQGMYLTIIPRFLFRFARAHD